MARFVTSNYFCETGGMTRILEKLRWESLKKRGETVIILLYKGLKSVASVPTDGPIPPSKLGAVEIITH